MSRLFPGDVVRVKATFLDPKTSAPIDPTSVTLKVRAPTAGGTQSYTFGVSPDVVKDGVGRYSVKLSLPTAGRWEWRWETSGVDAAAEEGRLIVLDSQFS